MEHVDAVVHLAGIIPPLSEQDPELANKVNVGGTQTMLAFMRKGGDNIPFVFTSSVAVFGPTTSATEPLNPDRSVCNPVSIYAKTKMQAEDLIKESGIDYLIMRLTSIPYLSIRASAMKALMFTIPLRNRMEWCHPDDVALAILNAAKNFDVVKGNTLVIAGGPSQQMVYEDMLRAVLGTIGLPIPPSNKFTEEPFELDWYDTSKSQELLRYQQKTLDDYSRDLANQFPAPVIAIMRYIIGPVFGRIIVRLL